MRFKLSPAAKQDIADIWDYGESQWGAGRADLYLDNLGQRLIWLTAHQPLWKRRDDLGDGLYSYTQESHVIYFRLNDGNGSAVMEIIRLLHQRMDAQRHV